MALSAAGLAPKRPPAVDDVAAGVAVADAAAVVEGCVLAEVAGAPPNNEEADFGAEAPDA